MRIKCKEGKLPELEERMLLAKPISDLRSIKQALYSPEDGG
jgi:hypothetical protein